ncbi:hypothetical protein MMC11_006182 [Xylographa trunciseda]|nr:hypothetical protein [Xylographa trunciseda]
MDSPPPADEVPRSPKGPDLLWTSSIEAELGAWLRTGVFPFPELGLRTYDQFHGLSKIELRLVHHLSSVYRDLLRHGMIHCIAWVEMLPIFLDTAAGYDFVMSAILAFSATHLASVTNSVETKNLAYHHRGVALSGLHGAIGNFSEGNSDPILAASILLSWQASDWGGWTSLMQGISTVVSSMHAWKRNSRLALYVEDNVLFQPRTFARPLTATANVPVLPEDDRSLQQAIDTLQRLHKYLSSNHQLRACVEDVLQSAREIEGFSATIPAPQLFEKLQVFRSRLLWLPIALFQRAENFSLNLLVIAHLYAVGLAIDTSIPELNGAAFGVLVTAPIEEIDRQLRFSHSPTVQQTYHPQIADMMQFPRELASRSRFHLLSVISSSDNLQPGSQSPFGFQNLRIDSAPGTPGFPGTFPMFSNRSTEDLSVPPSPFLLHQSYNNSPTSQRHSQIYEQSARPVSIHEHRTYSGSSFTGGSPAYSPSYSPVPTFVEDEHSYTFGDSSTDYHGGFVTPTIWTEDLGPDLPFRDYLHNESADKGKHRRVS